MLGISIYLADGPIEQQEAYINKMAALGFESIFTSLHIPEDNPEVYGKRLFELGQLAKKYHLELVADVSPVSLQHLDLTWNQIDQLKEWGVTGLRVDYGVSEEIIAKLSRNLKIALNASTLTEENVRRLQELGAVQLEAWHNFYPRPETGLDANEFHEKNLWLKEKGFSVMAFIPGDGKRRGPLHQGLPTIEDHRELSTFAAFLDFYHNPYIDKIFIGDPGINIKSEEQFQAFKEGIILLRAVPFIDDQKLRKRVEMIHTNRPDSARDVIRSTESRQMAVIGNYSTQPYNTVTRPVGAITLDNERYGRYQGEIQVVKRLLPADEKVNVIGQVLEVDLPLLRYIKGGTKFKIQWIHQ